jgi:hypothetical protein
MIRTPYATAAALLVAAFFSQSAAAACYVVYGPDQDIVYRAPEPPVDMSYQIHQILPLVAPGATLVFSPDNHNCDLPINKLPLASAQGAAGSIGPAGMGGRPARADRG